VVITFLSDFGLQDDFVGTCHGVIKRIAPEAEIIDITHGIPPQHVLQGALVLSNALPYMPEGVHLAVVDPGVGGHRRPLALRTGEGRLLVGPDNGLLLPAADRLGGVEAAHELASGALCLCAIAGHQGDDGNAPLDGDEGAGPEVLLNVFPDPPRQLTAGTHAELQLVAVEVDDLEYEDVLGAVGPSRDVSFGARGRLPDLMGAAA